MHKICQEHRKGQDQWAKHDESASTGSIHLPQEGYKAAGGTGKVRQGMKNVSIFLKACEEQQ